MLHIGTRKILWFQKEAFEMECCDAMARVGQKAPLFTADGYNAKDPFKTYSLADCKGKRVLLFFYPGDFTYV